MGIEKFFNSIKKNKLMNYIDNFTFILNDKIRAKNIFFDFNSIVHLTSSRILNNINNIIYKKINNINFTDEEIYNYILTYHEIDITTFDIAKLSNFFSNIIDTLIIDHIIIYIFDFLNNYIIVDSVNFIYISFDGVPTKAKLYEQKKRRYMGEIINLSNKFILSKCKNNFDKNRLNYEKYKISWNKSNITPGTKFMHILYQELTSVDFEIELKKLCYNLDNIYISSVYQKEEAEHKIVNFIRNSVDYDDIIIYSPDSDFTLLALLIETKSFHKNNIENIKIIRYDQQKKHFNLIDINKLSKNIFFYIKNSIQKKNLSPSNTNIYNVKKDNVINDIVFIFTIFGNDFIPKLYSYDIKNNVKLIFDSYIDNLKNGYIVDKINSIINFSSINEKEYILNISNLLKFFKTISKKEHDLMRIKYINDNYKNDRLITNYYQFNDFIANDSLTSILNKKNRNIIPKKDDRSNIEKLKDKYISNNNIISKNEDLTSCDIEYINFINRKKEYSNVFEKNNNIGYYYFDKTNIYSNKFEKDKNKYYEFFLSNYNIQNVIDEYIFGLFWLFDFYYNKINNLDNKINTWYYYFDHSPLLTDIVKRLELLHSQTNKNKNLNYEYEKKIKNYEVNIRDYFNTLEQYIYITPKNIIINNLNNFSDKNIIKIINYIENDNYFIDLKKYVKKVIDDKNKNIIDCNDKIFFNKCIIKNIKLMDRKQDIKFINSIRNINTSFEINKLKSNIDKSHNFYSVKYYNYSSVNEILARFKKYYDKYKYKYAKLSIKN